MINSQMKCIYHIFEKMLTLPNNQRNAHSNTKEMLFLQDWKYDGVYVGQKGWEMAFSAQHVGI